MAGEFVIGNMIAKLAADTGDFIKDMKGAGDVAKKFQKDAGAVEQGGKKVSGAFSGMGTAIKSYLMGGALVGAGYALVNFMADSVREAEDAARVQAQLEAVLKSTGGAAGVTAGQINDMADELSKATGVEDDLIVKNSALLLTFTKVGEEVFPEAMEAALNMSAVMGQDLQSSIVQVGKALNDPIEGVSALRRVGVQLTDEQEDLVKSLMATGKTAEAQGIILSELQTEFGGAAAAMHEAGSQSDTLRNSWANLKEEMGRGLLPVVGDSNSGVIELVDSITLLTTTENELKEAVSLGIIKQGEATEQMLKYTFTSYSVADSLKWVTDKTEEWNYQQDAGIAALNSGKSALEGYTGAVENTTEATLDVAGANKQAEQTTKDWMAELDTGIDNTIGNWLEQLNFMQAGGGEIQAAGEAVKAALLAGRITPAEAEYYWNELYVSAQALQVELGKITAEQAAENIRDTLNVSLKEAKSLIEEVKRKGQFNITSTINVKIKYSEPGWSISPGGVPHKKKASGGPVEEGEPYWVGELGPELFVPPASGHIVPNSQLERGSSGGGDMIYEGDIIINNYNEQAAAINTAMLWTSRRARLNAGMG